MKQLVVIIVAVILLLWQSLRAQTSQYSPLPAPNAGLPPGWDEIDPRFVFLTVRLASVETSLDAVNKAMKQAGYRQAVKQDEATRYQKGNEWMDRNAGGPVRWQDFYGRSAEKFFYHPVDRNSSYHTETALGQKTPRKDSGDGVQESQGVPVSQRPPQFDYIYKANNDAQQRTQAEILKLSGQWDALMERKRQLEAQQVALWCEISFQAVSSRDFSSKPLYRFSLKIEAADAASKQRQEAINAATEFVRTADHAMADAELAVDRDPSGAFDSFNRSIAEAWKDVDDRVILQQTLLLDMDDAATPLGRFMAAAKRLPSVARNVPEANRLALEGDQAGDDQQKQTFRAALQQALFDCAANLYTANDCVLGLARDWKAAPDLGKQSEAPSAVPQPVVRNADRPSNESPQVATAATKPSDVQPPEVQRVEPASNSRSVAPATQPAGSSIFDTDQPPAPQAGDSVQPTVAKSDQPSDQSTTTLGRPSAGAGIIDSRPQPASPASVSGESGEMEITLQNLPRLANMSVRRRWQTLKPRKIIQDLTVASLVVISQNESPCLVNGLIQIEKGGALTIQPGVILLFGGSAGIRNRGTLTMSSDDDWIVLAPADSNGGWAGLDCEGTLTAKRCLILGPTQKAAVYSSSSKRLSFAECIFFANKDGLSCGESASASVTNCLFVNNVVGLSAHGDGGKVSFSNCLFLSNKTAFGTNFAGSGEGSQCTFYGNDLAVLAPKYNSGVKIYSSNFLGSDVIPTATSGAPIDAEGNFWGEELTRAFNAGNTPGRKQRIKVGNWLAAAQKDALPSLSKCPYVVY